MEQDGIILSDLVDIRHAEESPLKSKGTHPPPFWGPGGRYLGHEWAQWRYDTLDQRVDQWLEREPKTARAVLDMGCATGVRASQFAAMGHRVTALDLLDRSADIASRNASLLQTAPATCPIAFAQADLCQTATWALAQSFDLIHIRRVLTFVGGEALDDIFAQAARLMADDGVLVVSFIAIGLDRCARPPEAATPALSLGPGLHAHDVDEVRQAMRRHGLATLELLSDALVEVGLIARKASGNDRPGNRRDIS